MFEWKTDLRNALLQLTQEEDDEYEEAVDGVIDLLGLSHSEIVHQALYELYNLGVAHGQQREYSHPS